MLLNYATQEPAGLLLQLGAQPYPNAVELPDMGIAAVGTGTAATGVAVLLEVVVGEEAKAELR